MDAGRRYKTPGSETKDLIAHSTASSVSFMFDHFCLVLKFQGAPLRASGGCCARSGFASYPNNPEFRELELFTVKPYPAGRHYHYCIGQ